MLVNLSHGGYMTDWYEDDYYLFFLEYTWYSFTGVDRDDKKYLIDALFCEFVYG